LRGNGIRAGPTNGAFTASGFNLGSTNYFDPVGVSDVYWGVGTNNTLNGQGGACR